MAGDEGWGLVAREQGQEKKWKEPQLLPDSDCGCETSRVAMRLHSCPTSSRSCSTFKVSGATLTVEMEGEETSMTLSASRARASKVISPDEAKTMHIAW